MGHTPADNPMLLAAWTNDAFVRAMRTVKYPESQTSFSLLRPAGEVQVGKFGTAQYGNRMVELHFDHWLNTEFLVRDLSIDIDFEAIVRAHLYPAVEDLISQYQKVIDLGKNIVVFGRLPLDAAAIHYGARQFRCDFNDVSIRATCQYDVKERGMRVVLDAVVGLERETPNYPEYVQKRIASSLRKELRSKK